MASSIGAIQLYSSKADSSLDEEENKDVHEWVRRRSEEVRFFSSYATNQSFSDGMFSSSPDPSPIQKYAVLILSSLVCVLRHEKML